MAGDGFALANLGKHEIPLLGANAATGDLIPVWDISAGKWVLCTVAQVLAAS